MNTHSAPLPRVVLDTNVVLDLLLWNDPRSQWLRAALAGGQVAAYTSAACLLELQHVLARPHLAGTTAQTHFDEYLSLVQTCAVSALEPPLSLPRCRDAEDQKFIALAHAAGAHVLISRDKHLLRLAKRLRQAIGCQIATPEQATLLVGSPGASP